jgi:flagellar hook-basal body complex protein FliE
MISNHYRKLLNHKSQPFVKAAITASTRRFSTNASQNESQEPQTTFKQTLSNAAFTAVQETVKAAAQMKEFMVPEDLQKEETNEDVIQEILRSNYLAKQTMK